MGVSACRELTWDEQGSERGLTPDRAADSVHKTNPSISRGVSVWAFGTSAGGRLTHDTGMHGKAGQTLERGSPDAVVG